ncbi:Uncharacterised protein [Burkholderia pseudomallei]|uniref:Uncharacterized protein n=2 Tax=Burkholderia pseudomallei TaxID=28450 RepID=A0AAX0U0H3_BURPE|nr:hypothetical protein [Burkholderia pseudomallei]ABN89092.1 conserved hypothetical protein [Burkholderia pseudomallei 1106a]AFR17572.1 hypothetical protein BPC006_I3738 [Burkholderia pseudomallei BPC006]AIO13950.1 hypothetical protein DP58_1856 [Burkholderia pseudomallei]AIO91663.1 hypothetical protein DP48_305 [Burkholderia pseudomallei]EES25041.1 conserved hypothetical protein [Burkholderia pseudomallei 1106b]
MTFSRHGVLAQAFVTDALSKHASHIAAMSPEALKGQFGDRPMISAEAWQAVAREIAKSWKPTSRASRRSGYFIAGGA